MPTWTDRGTSGAYTGYIATLNAQVDSQDMASNTSKISWNVTWTNHSTQGHWTYMCYGAIRFGSIDAWDFYGNWKSGAPNQTTQVASGTTQVPHDSEGFANLNLRFWFRPDVIAEFFGGVNTTWSLPRIAVPPGKPSSAPTVTHDELTLMINAKSAPSDPKGGSITHYELEYRDKSSGFYGQWTMIEMDGNREVQFLPTYFAVDHQFRTRAVSEAGPGEWSNVRTLRTNASGPRVKFNDEWRNSVPYVKHEGVWRPCIVYIKESGVWRVSGG